jgi:hypothetical protein
MSPKTTAGKKKNLYNQSNPQNRANGATDQSPSILVIHQYITNIPHKSKHQNTKQKNQTKERHFEKRNEK